MDPFERLRYQSPDRRKQLLDELIDLELLGRRSSGAASTSSPKRRSACVRCCATSCCRRCAPACPAPGDISEADARRYYDEHRDDFREPERRRVAHIALGSEAEAKAVLEKALSVSAAEWGKLVRGQVDQTRAASPASPCRPELAGDLGIVGPPGHARGENPNVPEAAAGGRLRDRQVGRRFASTSWRGGRFHVVRLTGKTDARDRTFADAERSIRVALVQERIRAREAELEPELKKKLSRSPSTKRSSPRSPFPAPRRQCQAVGSAR